MSRLIDVKDFVSGRSDHEVDFPDDDDNDDDDNDDDPEDFDLNSSAIGANTPSTPMDGRAKSSIDAELFRGVMRVLLHRPEVGKNVKGHGRVDYQSLMLEIEEEEEENLEVAWFYRNLDNLKKFGEEIGNLESGVRHGCGHFGLLTEMLRRCLLKRRYRQAAYAVWAIAAHTRDALVNRDIPTLVLKTALEIFVAAGGENDLREGANIQFSALERLVGVLLDGVNIDPRDVGVHWLPLLLQHDRFDTAARLQSRIETERPKQFHSKIVTPWAKEVKALFTALTGLSCAFYAQKLRTDGDEVKPRNWDETRARTVTFFDFDMDALDERKANKTSAEEINAELMAADKREAKAKSMEEQAIRCFEEVVFIEDHSWDGFLSAFLGILRRQPHGEKRCLEVLTRYREVHPWNPNAHEALIDFLEKFETDEEEDYAYSVEERRRLYDEVLVSYNELCPMNKTIVFKLVDRLNEFAAVGVDQIPRRSLRLVFDLLDFPVWKRDAESWRLLAHLLRGGECSPARVAFARECFREEWFECRADWWPKMHFGSAAAAGDLECVDAKKLIKAKLAFLKFVQKISSDSLFSQDKSQAMTQTYFQSYVDKLASLKTTNSQ